MVVVVAGFSEAGFAGSGGSCLGEGNSGEFGFGRLRGIGVFFAGWWV